MRGKWRELAERLGSWKYVLLVGLVGLALLAWPSGQSAGESDTATEEARLEALLSQIEGVGEVSLLLSDSGAAIVCQGADSAAVRLEITEAVRCYTGLGADKIEIFKMTEG
ncbi:MAG: hypothetical protein LUH42_07955 [Oscillospiraceae bacterium]|nr:hypothetical protein [Oscillospiraceae bacterium]